MKRSGLNGKSPDEKIGYAHIAINIGSREKVDSLTKKIETDGYLVNSKPRVTGDGYYESVILDPENNKIELCAINHKKITKMKVKLIALTK